MKYIKEDVEVMLKEHRQNEAKLTEIMLKEEEYQERLNYASTVYEDTQKEIIEGMQLSGQGFDTMHSNTNKVSDKVATVAMTYHKEEVHINKEDRQFLEKRLRDLSKEKVELNKVVVRVKNMMNPLSQEEKFVIEAYYMDKAKWDSVEKLYFKEFEKYKSIKQLQSYRDIAIDNMLKIVNTGE